MVPRRPTNSRCHGRRPRHLRAVETDHRPRADRRECCIDLGRTTRAGRRRSAWALRGNGLAGRATTRHRAAARHAACASGAAENAIDALIWGEGAGRWAARTAWDCRRGGRTGAAGRSIGSSGDNNRGGVPTHAQDPDRAGAGNGQHGGRNTDDRGSGGTDRATHVDRTRQRVGAAHHRVGTDGTGSRTPGRARTTDDRTRPAGRCCPEKRGGGSPASREKPQARGGAAESGCCTGTTR